jgi:hypothetical protein
MINRVLSTIATIIIALILIIYYGYWLNKAVGIFLPEYAIGSIRMGGICIIMMAQIKLPIIYLIQYENAKKDPLFRQASPKALLMLLGRPILLYCMILILSFFA